MLAEDHSWVEGLALAWPTGSRSVARTLLIFGYRFGLTTLGTRPLLPGLRMGFRMQRPATDKTASSWPVPRQFPPPSY
jgi:hypothetical protein